MVPNEDGRDVETILIGREGAVGGIVSQGYLPAYTRIIVKFGGPFVRLPVGKLDAAKAKSRTLRNIFARYADCMLAQIFQSTACNAIHSIEQRTAKWIISAMERTDGDDVVPLTHEQLRPCSGSAAPIPAGSSRPSRRKACWRPAAARSWCATPMRCASGPACATRPSKTISKRCCGGSIPTPKRAIRAGADARKSANQIAKQTIVFWRFLNILRRNA